MAYRNAEGDIVNWARGLVAAAEEAAIQELEVTMKEGEEFAVGLIATRGTFESGKRGRIESGHMIQSISSRVDRLTNGGARGFFGWLDAWNNPENKYFVYQEGGFEHIAAGRYIQGMYAIADAAEAAFENMKGRMARAVKQASAPQFAKRVVVMGKETKSG